MKAERFRQGFSLVEVATSLGVISFALVALIGMIPLGLENGRTAMGETRATQLLKMISATLESEPFDAADCFQPEANAGRRLDFSTLGMAGTSPGALPAAADVVLYASYDVRDLPRLERPSAGEIPAEAIYRIELRCRREVLQPVGGAARVIGSNVNVRISPLRGKQALGEAWIYVPRFARTSLTASSGTAAGGGSPSSP